MYRLLLGIALLLLSVPLLPAQAAATITLESDDRGQPLIVVGGAGAQLGLADIRAGLGANGGLLEETSPGVWLLKASLLIDRDVSLSLSPAAGASELRLRSEPAPLPPGVIGYDYSKFVYLRTNDGIINIAGAKVSSWDPAAAGPDTNEGDGRAYLLAKYDAQLNISGADLGYLGFADGESYGVSWRDADSPSNPGVRRQRVTGTVINSRFHHNYYGVYTYQASGMTFRGNTFDNNVLYGFDPHDYSIDFVVEDNQAFENGSHGFIIARGCTGFVMRRNVSHHNSSADPTKLAHGFMLDPGSPNSSDPQAPSSDNLLEDNHAYDNSGYGLRVLSSNTNTIRNNLFERNRIGITLEQGSTGNIVDGNTVSASQIHGIFLRGTADGNQVINNTLQGNAGEGIYVKSNNNIISGNSASGTAGSGISLLPETTAEAAAADLALPGTTLAEAQESVDAELVGEVLAAAAVANNQITGNSVTGSGSYGIELKGALNTTVSGNSVANGSDDGIYLADAASGNQLTGNTITGNAGYGIKANGADVAGNTWSQNRLSGNAEGPITATGGANGGIQPPVLVQVEAKIFGQATPGDSVELLSLNSQGVYTFLQQAQADAAGRFNITLPAGATALLAFAIDSGGNASGTTSLSLEPFEAPEPPAQQLNYYLPLVVR